MSELKLRPPNEKGNDLVWEFRRSALQLRQKTARYQSGLHPLKIKPADASWADDRFPRCAGACSRLGMRQRHLPP